MVGIGTLQRSFIAWLAFTVVGCNPHATTSGESAFDDKGIRDGDNEYIDIHSHVACFGAPGRNPDCYTGDSLRRTFKYRLYPTIFGLSGSDYERSSSTEYRMTDPLGDLYIFKHLHDLLAQQNGFKKSVVLAMDEVYDEDGVVHRDQTEYYVSNKFVADGIELFPDTFLMGASVHPFRNDAVEALREAKANGAVLVKLISPIHRFHPNGEGHSEQAKEKLRLFYETLVELGLPLLIHADDEGSFSAEHRQYAGVHKLQWPLDLGVTVIVAHAGTRGESQVPTGFCGAEEGEALVLSHLDQLRCMFPHYDNLYADISVLPHAPVPNFCQSPRKGKLEVIVDDDAFNQHWDRILWGSDYPLNHWSMNAYQCVRDSGRFSENNVSLSDISHAESYWQRTAYLAIGLGVPEHVFGNSERFLRERGLIR